MTDPIDPSALLSAIAAIHDHLHAGRVDEAHKACECALSQGEVRPANITVDDAAHLMRYMAAFNQLTQESGMNAACLVLVPSATRAGYVSVQIGGCVDACKMLERAMGRSSTYMGDHGQGKA